MGGSDRREAKICPFTDPEEIYAFDPAREYGVPEHHDLVRFYQNWYQSQQAANPDQLCTMGYYKTIISGCIRVMPTLLATTPRTAERSSSKRSMGGLNED